MTFELTMLALAVALGLAQIVAASHAASLQRGYRWTAGPRDQPVGPLTGVAGRLQRALRNFGETFPLFLAAVLAAHLAGRTGTLTQWGTALYVAGRLAYVGLYAAGVPLIRSLAWNVATAGIIMILLALL
jgi:uncharacterized MAPEG superfamily protein